MTLLIRVFVTIVVVLGIASVLVVSVVQKRKEIGIMRAAGVSRFFILQVFFLEGVFIGITGGVSGALLAWGWRTARPSPLRT